MTSIASSFDIASGPHGGGPEGGQAAGPQNDRSPWLEGDRVLEMGRGGPVTRPDRPTIRIDGNFRPTEVEHRLDCQDHAALQQAPPAAGAVIGDLGLLVQGG